MHSPPITQPPHRPSGPPEWLRGVLLGATVVALVVLLVILGWPMLALVLAAVVFGSGVMVGYRGARNEEFTKHVERWLE